MTKVPAQSEQGFATRQLHAPVVASTDPRPRVTPLYLTAGFQHESFDQAVDHFSGGDGYSYTRVANPTTAAVEDRVANLEGGAEALLVGSGQAALAVTLLGLLSAGDHILSAESLYEGSRGFFMENLPPLGITTDFVAEANDPAAWEREIRPNTRALFLESIPNPKNEVADIAAIARVADDRGIPLIVDNTLATPYLLRPIEHGAAIVIHSASKFLAGHGAVLGGAIIGRDKLSHFREVVAPRFGPTASPFNSFLIGQGIETLSLRVERHCANALIVARWLEQQPEVDSVDYSGLESSPYYALAQRYLPRGQGSVFSFTLNGGIDAARAFINALQVFTHMTHLGDVRSLVLHLATTSHAQRTPEQLELAGIGPGTLRVSIGIEDVSDLIDDLERGLVAVRAAG